MLRSSCRSAFFAVSFLALLTAAPSFAQDGEGDSIFRFENAALHVETERPEVCLTFNRPFFVTDRNSLASLFRLKEDGVALSVLPRDLSLAPSELCLQQLRHHHRYNVALKGLKDETGKLLASPVNLSFSVPDRKPSLVFLSDDMSGFPRLDPKGLSDVVEKAVNVSLAGLALYRLEDEKDFPSAWDHHVYINLAPSESWTFASEKGKVVWQDRLVFGNKLNVEQKLPVTLPDISTLKPGVYFLGASPQKIGGLEVAGEKEKKDLPSDAGDKNSVALKKDDAKKDSKDAKEAALKASAALRAGVWFLVSDLRAAASFDPDGLTVMVSDVASNKAAAKVSLRLYSKEGRLIAEGKSSADGLSKIALKKQEAHEASFLVAFDEEGNTDFLDLREAGKAEPVRQLEGPTDSILLGREIYKAGEEARIVLASPKGEEGSLKLLRPDGAVYAEEAVAKSATPFSSLTMKMPLVREAAVWKLLWSAPDGSVRAQLPVKVSENGAWAKIEMKADHEAVETDGSFGLRIKVSQRTGVDGASSPLSWRGGEILVRGKQPVFASYKNYRFGVLPSSQDVLLKQRFLTSEDGSADIRLQVPSEAFETGALSFQAKIDGQQETTEITVPVRTEEGNVGISLLGGDQPVAENGEAVFSVVALDSFGKRRERDDLFYHVFEEGRRFAWVPSDGHWDYKPLAQRRRLGGDRLSLSSSGDNIVRWPVTAGHYILEVTDDSGRLLAQKPFEAVWNPSRVLSSDQPQRLRLTSSASKKGRKLSIFLQEPAFVTLVDGEGKKILQKDLAQGSSDVDLSENVHHVSVFASFGRQDGYESLSLNLPSSTIEDKAGLLLSAPSSWKEGEEVTVVVSSSETHHPQKSEEDVLLRLTPLEEEEPGMVVGPLKLDGEGKASFHFKVPSWDGKIGLEALMSGPSGKFETVSAFRNIQRSFLIQSALGEGVPASLAGGDKAFVKLRLVNRSGAVGAYSYQISSAGDLDIDGLKTGKVIFNKGQSHDLAFSLSSAEGGDASVKLEVEGPAKFHMERVFEIAADGDRKQLSSMGGFVAASTLTAGESLALPLKDKKDNENDAFLVSSVPLTGVVASWKRLEQVEPFSTVELAHWLQAVRFWKPLLIEAKLADPLVVQRLYDRRVRELMGRQNEDGGFPLISSGGKSDLTSTAEAVAFLNNENDGVSPVSVAWLRDQLANTWFGDQERSARAAGLLALGGKAAASLAANGKGDLSALRYLSEGSREKDMTPLAMAQIALALAQNNDSDQALFWIEKVKGVWGQLVAQGVDKASFWYVFGALAANPLVPEGDLHRLLNDIDVGFSPSSLEVASGLLSSMGRLIVRSGECNVVSNGVEMPVRGLLRVLPSEPGVPLFLRNPSKQDLFVLQASEKDSSLPSPLASSVQRQLFRLDGSKVDQASSLEVGDKVILLLQGTLKGKKLPDSIVVSVPQGAGAEILAASDDAILWPSLWPFLPSSLSPMEAFVLPGGRLDASLEVDGSWKMALLLRAGQSGSFVLPPLSLRDPEGRPLDVLQNKIRISIH